VSGHLPRVFARWGSVSTAYAYRMLLVYRMPLLDFRPFAADEAQHSSVRLPSAWEEGEFVRGVGVIRRRPKRSVSDWPAERTYADFGKMLRFQPKATEDLNRNIRHAHILRIQRRLWNALPGTDCLFDFDVSFPFRIHALSARSAAARTYSLARISRIPMALCSASVSVDQKASGTGGTTVPLLESGHRIATRFSRETAGKGTALIGHGLVHDGQPVLVIEAPGLSLRIDIGIPVDRCWVKEVELLSFILPGSAVPPLRCYVLMSAVDSPDARSRIREARVHILRMHSIQQFMLGLVAQVRQAGREGSLLAAEPSAPYDRLQNAISILIRKLQDARRPGGESVTSLLPAAAITLAEADAQKGNAAGVKANLARVGHWVLQLANATSCTVAAAAINHALGLQ
jgi:hypothetical protein